MENQENLKEQTNVVEENSDNEQVSNKEEQLLNEEEKQKEKELIKEREAFDLENGIEFQQVITKEDAIEFNFYLQKNSSNLMRRTFTIVLGLFLIGYIIYIKQYYWMILIGALIVIYSAFLYMPIQRKLTKRMFEKNGFKDLIINMKFGEKKLKYELDNETLSPLVEYRVVKKVIKTEKYLYLHISLYSVIIVKLIDLDCKDELIEFVKGIYEPLKIYKEK